MWVIIASDPRITSLGASGPERRVQLVVERGTPPASSVAFEGNRFWVN